MKIEELLRKYLQQKSITDEITYFDEFIRLYLQVHDCIYNLQADQASINELRELFRHPEVQQLKYHDLEIYKLIQEGYFRMIADYNNMKC
jgi:hypothetical protein